MKANAPGMIYSPQIRVERIIATGRMVLSGFFLLAIWIDPSEPSRHAQVTYAILSWYFVYSVVLFLATWRSYFVEKLPRIVTHIIDLLVFAAVLFFTEGPTSPFFVYFVYLLVSASLRWQWRGTLWTAGAALMAVIILAFYPSPLFREPEFELNRFIIQIVYLAVISLLLGYVGAYDDKMRRDLSHIAAWPSFFDSDPGALLCEMLAHVAGVLKAPRIILAWEEKEEPGRHLASWSGNDFQQKRETPQATLSPLVAESLTGTSFFCLDASAPQPSIVTASSAGFRIVPCSPLQEQFQKHFDIKSVLSVPLQGEMLYGRFFAVGKSSINEDDLVLGEITARQIASRLDQFFLTEQLQNAAASEERLRLARDLHDGILQSLTVAALQMEVVHQRMEKDPQAAPARLLEIQKFIVSVQRDLRLQIQELKLPLSMMAETMAPLPDRLAELADRIRQNWGLNVEMNAEHFEPPVSQQRSQQIYFIIHEALINAAKHAAASPYTLISAVMTNRRTSSLRTTGEVSLSTAPMMRPLWQNSVSARQH